MPRPSILVPVPEYSGFAFLALGFAACLGFLAFAFLVITQKGTGRKPAP
jgi:hypothetical protein